MDKTNLKSAAYAQIARMGKALAHGSRLEILDLLAQGPCTVESIARSVNMSVANTSAHLQILRGAGLLRGTRRGSYVSYCLAGEEVGHLLIALRTTAETHMGELEKVLRDYLGDRAGFDAIDRHELVERLRNGEATLLDVRPRGEYDQQHLPQAVSMPLGELEAHLAQLPPGKIIVAYCRGPYCLLSVEAVQMLRARGFSAMQLKDGVHEWQAAGLPVELGANS